MALNLSSLPLDLVASILIRARCNISDIINWRMVSRAFRDACMQVGFIRSFCLDFHSVLAASHDSDVSVSCRSFTLKRRPSSTVSLIF